MLDLHSLLEKAIEIAVIHHKGQKDKGGNPYILHPLAVMKRLVTIEEKIVGVLHDVPEDTTITLEDLRNFGFPKFIIEGVDSVTKRKGETRDESIYRARFNSIGRNVKIADNTENRDLSRIPVPTEKDMERLKMYEREYLILTEDNWSFDNRKWTKI